MKVSFNGRLRTGWVAGTADHTQTDPNRVKPIERVEGTVRWFDETDLQVWRWVADRYAGTLSGAIRHALPARVVRVEKEAASWGQPLTSAARAVGGDRVGGDRAGGDRASPPCARPGWAALDGSALLKAAHRPDGLAYHLRAPLHPAEGEGPLLADLVARGVAAGHQVLVLTPSPAPGPADDMLRAAGTSGVDLRGELPAADRYRAFLRLRRGDLSVAVGERSLALMPLPDLGLVIVVDEASPAYKERRNPRHHVRDAVLGRARIQGATAVLTSSVLSAIAWRHLQGGHLRTVRADRDTERRLAPHVSVIDRTTLAPSARRTRLVRPVTAEITQIVQGGGRVIVLAAAKGSGTSLACAACRARLECRNCGGGVTAAPEASDEPDAPGRYACASCGWSAPAFACIDCGAIKTFPLRAGARRLATELRKTYPEAHVAHMEGFDQAGPHTTPSICVMTRGSVVPRPSWLTDQGARQVDLLVIADPDVLVGRPSVDATEDALRLWLDAARLTRRIVVQTGHPEQPGLQGLVRLDPDGFWEGETERRRALSFPPVGSLVRLTNLRAAQAQEVRQHVPGQLLGPDLDHAALLKTTDLRGTLTALGPLRQDWARVDLRVRIDVDPIEIG